MQNRLETIRKLEKELIEKIDGNEALNHYIKNYIGSTWVLIEMIIVWFDEEEKKVIREYEEKVTQLRILSHRLNNKEVIKYLEEQYLLNNICTSHVDKILATNSK